MFKKVTSLYSPLLLLGIFVSLNADIKVGILKSIVSNGQVVLLNHNVSVTCKPFGVIPIEKIQANAIGVRECQEEIQKYHRAHPHDRNFAREYLHLHQSYHYEMLPEGCILYANGAESYSEMLLIRGLALIDPNVNRPEWNNRLLRSQNGAEKGKKGLHDSQIRASCIKEEK